MKTPACIKSAVRTRASSPHRAASGQADLAFTLIEMLLVVVMLATLTGTLAISLSGRLDRHALRIAGKDLAAAVRFSVSETKLTRLPHRVAFHDDLTRYRVERAESTAGSEYGPVKSLAGRMKMLAKQVRILGTSVDGEPLDTAPESLPQYPDGSGFHGKIQLANRTGETLTIEVSSVTGQVWIAE